MGPCLSLTLSCTPADPAWYQTWPGPGSRPSGTQKTPASQHPQNWSATWTKDSKRRNKRWVKYEGIGPVDESGMPIAPRSVSPGLGSTDGWGPGTHSGATKAVPKYFRLKQGFNHDGFQGHEPHKITGTRVSELYSGLWSKGELRMPPGSQSGGPLQ